MVSYMKKEKAKMKLTAQEKNRLYDAEKLLGCFSPCLHCEHFDRNSTDKTTCKFCPEIPEKVFYGECFCMGFADNS
jgi:hypothetical protein